MPGTSILVLGWRIGDRLCAVDAGKVAHIEPAFPVRAIPRPVDGVVGAGFYHGQAVPVLDFSWALLGESDHVWPESAVFLIIRDAGGMFAVRVDGVEGISPAETDDLKFPEPDSGFPGARFARASLEIDGEDALLIDFRRVLRHIGIEFGADR